MNLYKRYYKNANRRAMESLFRDLQLTLIYALLYLLAKRRLKSLLLELQGNGNHYNW